MNLLRPLQDLPMRVKLALPLSGVVICIGALIYSYVPSRLEAVGLHGLREKANSVTLVTAGNLAPALVFTDSIQIAEDLQIVNQNSDLTYASVFSGDGRLLASVGYPPPGSGGTFLTGGPTVPAPSLITIEQPIIHHGKTVGVLRTGFSTQAIELQAASSRREVALYAFLLAAVGVILVFVVSGAVTGRLAKVSAAAHDIAAGRLSARASVGGDDEVGRLASTFDRMVERLEETQAELSAINTDLESRVQERTAELQNEIQVRKETEHGLEAALHEKEILLKEVHHRVKNNMQVVSSLLQLQSNYITDEEMKTLFLDSQNRVRSMALIHERLYRSRDFSQIDIQEYCRSLLADMFRSYSVAHLDHTIEGDHVFLSVDQAIPCGLIVNELVSNALKHGFPDKREGTIRVLIEQLDEDCVRLEVSDNGVGIAPGIKIEEAQTLGLQLVTMLVSQIGGTLSVRSCDGTTISFWFPNSIAQR